MSKISAAILEIADDLRGAPGGDAVADKITMRILGERVPLLPLTGDEIRAIRAKANMSQAVFASLLNIGTGYLSDLERGVKPVKGAVLPLLSSISFVALALSRSWTKRRQPKHDLWSAGQIRDCVILQGPF